MEIFSRLNSADCIKIKPQAIDLTINKLICNSVEILNIEGEFIEISIESLFEQALQGDELNEQLDELGDQMFHFLNVNQKAVTGFYFGCNFSESSFQKIKTGSEIQKFENLNGNILRANLSSDEYKLVLSKN